MKFIFYALSVLLCLAIILGTVIYIASLFNEISFLSQAGSWWTGFKNAIVGIFKKS